MVLVDINRVGSLLDKVQKELTKDFQVELASNIQENVYAVLPSVTKSVKASFRPLKVSKGQKKQAIIRFYNKGEAVIMLEDYNRSYGYPRFINFAEEPHLRDWVMKAPVNSKLKQKWLKAKGLVVGKPKTTYFGRPINKWFTNAINIVDLEMVDTFDKAFSYTIQKIGNKYK
ncbi:MAG: hypothetical protein EOL97_09620 [Spirochaetia bacterium]|nr:hypothetical protein [Spirochaetia bacterium]